MSEYNPSIMSHVSLGTQDMNKAMAFYDALLATVGAKRQETIEVDGMGAVAAAYGKEFPEFWIQLPENRQPAAVGNGVHVGFIANDEKTVHAFHEAALKAGGTDEGGPGPRPLYGPEYYGCFVRDLDGNKLEATFWDPNKSA